MNKLIVGSWLHLFLSFLSFSLPPSLPLSLPPSLPLGVEHLWLELPVLCHWTTTAGCTTSPHNLLYILTAQARGVLGSTAGLFTFLLFHLITSKIHLFLARGKMLWAFRVRKLLGMGSFLMERTFWLTPKRVLMVFCRHTGLWKPEGRTRNGSLGALSGKDVFVVFPTGYSKLLCYACWKDLWRPFLASETSAEHRDKAACIYKHFQTSH